MSSEDRAEESEVMRSYRLAFERVQALEAELARERSARADAERERDGFRNGQEQQAHLFDLLWQDVHGPGGWRESAKRAETALAASLVAVRVALGTMQAPMERMEKVCALGMVEPACDHDALRSLRAAMRTLQDAHDAALMPPTGGGR
jgi:hypothetical protein